MERVDVKVLDRRKMIEVNGILFLALILSIVGCALLGPVQIDLSRAVKNLFSSDSNAEILLRTRLPRVLLGAAIGGGMAACGVVLQALLRNPLACPQMLGVSAVAFIWIYVLLGFFWLWSKGVSLNLITLGEDSALQLGVEISALQRQVFVASSLMIW